jgi:hypothetical protein
MSGRSDISGAGITSAELYTPAVLTPANLVSISVTPSSVSTPAGLAEQFTATGTYTDNHTETMQSAMWQSSETTVATVSNDTGNRGLAHALAIGTATITACAGAVCGSATLTVLPAVLVSIEVTPANSRIVGGTQQQFRAIGTYTDNSQGNLAGQATWTSSDTGVATINASGSATGANQGTTTITASVGSINGSTNLTVIWVFTSTGSLNTGRYYHTATLLNDGRVLVAGGFNGSSALSSGETYDPSFTTTAGSLNTARYFHTATLLSDGRVLLTGGTNDGGTGLSSAEIYDPATDSFTLTGSLSAGRFGHTAALLNDGRVLIAGGYTSGTILSSAEIYDPATGTFTSTGSLSIGRFYATATLLNNGRVLIAGGQGDGNSFPTTAELYDSGTGTFTTTGGMNTGRNQHSATLLNDGRVLIVAGYNGSYLNSAELYDPSVGTFTSTGSLSVVRVRHTATLLNNGLVLVAGGYDGQDQPFAVLRNADLYDPANGTFTPTGSLSTPRTHHTATLLNNGQVLMSGGSDISGAGITSAELYTPAVLTPANLVSISVAPATATLAVGTTQRFVATGTFNNNGNLYMQQLASVTWSSTNTNVADISSDITNHGIALAKTAGNTTITATDGLITGTATITASTLAAIAVMPANPTIPPGAAQQFIATGTLANNSTQNLTPFVTWTSSDPGVTINSAGLATAVNSGSASTITATFGPILSQASLSVQPITVSEFVPDIPLFGGEAAGIAVDPDSGNLYVAENIGEFPSRGLGSTIDILRVSADGTLQRHLAPPPPPQPPPSGFGGVTAVAFYQGRLYVADGVGYANPFFPQNAALNVVWQFDPNSGTPWSQFVTDPNLIDPTGLAFDSAGNLYVSSWGDGVSVGRVFEYDTSGNLVGTVWTAPDLTSSPYGLAIDQSDNLYIAGFGGSSLGTGTKIYKVTAADIATQSGNSTVFFDPGIHEPASLAFDGSGNLFASYYNSLKIFRIALDGSYVIFPGGGTSDDAPNGLAINPQTGDLFTVVNGSSTLDGSPAVLKIQGIQ